MNCLGNNTYREIYNQEQSFQAINDTIDTIKDTIHQVFSSRKIEKVIFIGCGTSLYIAQTAAFLFNTYTDIDAVAAPCSELIFNAPQWIGKKQTLVVPFTRKSVTTEVRRAIDHVRTMPNVKTLSITCCAGAKDYNDDMLYSPQANEQSIVMTSSFTSMVYMAAILAMVAGGHEEELTKLMKSPSIIKNYTETFDKAAEEIIRKDDINLFITLGQGVYYGIANECMNKVKEMSLSNSEAYYTLEYRHGPMSLVDDKTLIVLLASEHTGDYECKMMAEMTEKGAITVAIGKHSSQWASKVKYTIEIDTDFNDCQMAPIVGIFGQFIGYYAAARKQLNVDAPRHLAQAIIL